MNATLRPAAWALALVLVLGGRAEAQSGEAEGVSAGELTMKLITDLDAATPESVTRRIELPEDLPSTNERAAGEAGTDENGPRPSAGVRRAPGLSTAEEARERRRELGEEIADGAREHRENLGRSEDGPVLPDRLEEIGLEPGGERP